MSKVGPHCRIEFRACTMCPERFLTAVKSRRKYCSDDCAARAMLLRPDNRYTFEGALTNLRTQREVKKERRSAQREQAKVIPKPLPPVARNPIENRHVPGSIAFTLLYGGPAFSFNNAGDGRVGRGRSSARAIQIGGPNA